MLPDQECVYLCVILPRDPSPQAEVQRVHPTYYAIPVIVGASSNVIMPASAPLALLHELARVSFWRLLLFGLLAKAIVLSMVIVMVNVADKYGILSAQTTPE
nr:uncharacterized protein LOC129387837 [Dermacentor andersoni]